MLSTSFYLTKLLNTLFTLSKINEISYPLNVATFFGTVIIASHIYSKVELKKYLCSAI